MKKHIITADGMLVPKPLPVVEKEARPRGRPKLPAKLCAFETCASRIGRPYSFCVRHVPRRKTTGLKQPPQRAYVPVRDVKKIGAYRCASGDACLSSAEVRVVRDGGRCGRCYLKHWKGSKSQKYRTLTISVNSVAEFEAEVRRIEGK